MKPFPIPVVALGPGSQPAEDTLDYLSSPGEMAVFRAPAPREAASPAAIEGARRLLATLLHSMEDGAMFRGEARLSLLDVDPGIVAEVNELLGHGEVSVRVDAPRAAHIQESAFPGVWRIQALGEDGHAALDDVEAAPIPQLVRGALNLMRRVPRSLPVGDPGVMNAPAILGELMNASASWRPGDEPHIINLTLLPMTPEDLAYLAAGLGGGPVTILSRGYGNCRITTTALPNTWWVQYFNSSDQLILNTIEVVDVPVVALAAEEDLQDSVERLREWLGTL
jgi:hydrogenase-1 operon protein HyaF